jgi:predicted extracellular nuclease
MGTKAIKVGFLYKTATVATQGAYQIMNSSVDPDFIDTKNRPMPAQTFRELASDALQIVAVTHLKSKGSPCDDLGDPDLGEGQSKEPRPLERSSTGLRPIPPAEATAMS